MSRKARRHHAPSQVPEHASLKRYGRAIEATLDDLRALIRSFGVPAVDVDDVTQDVLLGAWSSILEGRYHPSELVEPKSAMPSWLYGVAWRQVSHYHALAWNRRTRLTPKPYALAGKEEVPSHEERVAARELLAVLNSLPAWAQVLLILHFVEECDDAMAALIHGGNVNTTYNRRRLARRRLAKALRGRRKP